MKCIAPQTPNDDDNKATKSEIAIRALDLDLDLSAIMRSDQAMAAELTLHEHDSLQGYGPEWFTKRFTKGRRVHLNWRGITAVTNSNGAPAGFCLWHLHKSRHQFVELFWLRVEPSCQRRGVARALLEAMAAAAATEWGGISGEQPELRLHCCTHNTGGIAFYERLGFCNEEKLVKRNYPEPGYASLRMIRRRTLGD